MSRCATPRSVSTRGVRVPRRCSGSGKSTFIRLLNREEVPEHGTIYVAGKDIGTLGRWKVPYLRRNIGYIFQDFKLLPNKTVAENVAFALEVIGKPRHVIKKQVPAILELVGLSEKMSNFPSELSGGEQQRVSIARAFVNRPLILLADDPPATSTPRPRSASCGFLTESIAPAPPSSWLPMTGASSTRCGVGLSNSIEG